jgi:hypothetical protein
VEEQPASARTAAAVMRSDFMLLVWITALGWLVQLMVQYSQRHELPALQRGFVVIGAFIERFGNSTFSRGTFL